MTRQVLILGGGLAGLATAYRLVPCGFDISILNLALNEHHPSQPSQADFDFPNIIHGFYQATWDLLIELAQEWPFPKIHPVPLEFETPAQETRSLPYAPWLSYFPAPIPISFSSLLSGKDRINLLNFFEKRWERVLPPDNQPDTRTVEAWLLSIHQTPTGIHQFWNPLCQYFLGCPVNEASVGVFLQILSRFFKPPQLQHSNYIVPPDFLQLLTMILQKYLLKKGVKIYPHYSPLSLTFEEDQIRGIHVDHYPEIKAQAIVSTLPPRTLLPLLPERIMAKYSYFSQLGNMTERTGKITQWTLEKTPYPAKIILPFSGCSWATIYPDPVTLKVQITCGTFQNVGTPSSRGESLNESTCQKILTLANGSPIPSLKFSSLQPSTQSFIYYPSSIGSRLVRPLTKTPIRNLFVSAPWTATGLPSSVESLLLSANACSQETKKFFAHKEH